MVARGISMMGGSLSGAAVARNQPVRESTLRRGVADPENRTPAFAAPHAVERQLLADAFTLARHLGASGPAPGHSRAKVPSLDITQDGAHCGALEVGGP